MQAKLLRITTDSGFLRKKTVLKRGHKCRKLPSFLTDSFWRLEHSPALRVLHGTVRCAKEALRVWAITVKAGGLCVCPYSASPCWSFLHSRIPSCATEVLSLIADEGCMDLEESTWVVVKIMAPFWVLSIIGHLVFRGPQGGP